MALRRIMLALGAGVSAAALTFVNLPTKAHDIATAQDVRRIQILGQGPLKRGGAAPAAHLIKAKGTLSGAAASLSSGR
jgi:hypothetical protein